MWEQYRKFLIPTQIFIVALCLTIYFKGIVNPLQAAIIFLFMELATLPGAWWGARLRRKIQGGRSRLPLEKR